MTKNLEMRGVDYNVAVAIFFIPFVLCGMPTLSSTQHQAVSNVVSEVPSNMILHKINRPSIYMGGIVIAWGVIMTLTGIVQNYAGLLATRFMLGIFE